MSYRKSVPFVKPSLEILEARDQPSFLLGGLFGGNNVVSQLATPLNNTVTDMQNAQKDLAAQVAALPTAPVVNIGTNAGPTAQTFSKAVGDYQRILNDQHSINAQSQADQTFLNAAAMAEFQAGDPVDLILLRFGNLINFNPTADLTKPLDQANNIVNDATVQSEVTANHNYGIFQIGVGVVASLDLGTIQAATTTPSF